MNLLIKKIKNLYLQKEKMFNTIIGFVYCFIALILFTKFRFFGWAFFYTPTIIFLLLNYKKIFNVIGKYWKSMFLVSGLLFFFGNIYAEKALNSQFDIETDYLNYSTSIYAVVFVASVISGVIFLRYYTPYLLKSTWYVICKFFTRKYDVETNKLSYIFAPFIMIGLFFPVVYTLYFAEKLTPYYIMIDSYSVSDCGPRIENISYIRKNSRECYFVDRKDLSNLSLQIIKSSVDE